MKISTKGRYALRLMIELARSKVSEPIRLKDLAERQNISEKYSEQIISLMRRGGIVRARRGTQGGYELAKKPEEITIGNILRLTEGDLAPVPCIEHGLDQCPIRNSCATIAFWLKLNDAINSVVDGTTLEDLAKSSSKQDCIDLDMALNI
ncbi:MAG: RrF2 family transcriptional regulator [Succinivibrionaceae bacterium]